MTQFSTPSSEFSVIETLVALTAVGGANRVDVVNDPEESKYLNALNSDTVDGGLGRIVYGMQDLVDPLVDTDHEVHIVVRGVPGSTSLIDFALGINDISTIFWTVRLTEADLTGVFTELIYTLLDTEVQAIRAAAAYSSILQFVVGAQLDPLGYIDVAFIQFEVPGSGIVSDIDITGDGGLVITGQGWGLDYFEGGESSKLLLSGEAELGSNEFGDTSIFGEPEGGLILSGEAFFATFDITSNGGLQIGNVGGPQNLVLSVDISGIYTIVVDKDSDTLYNRGSSVATLETNIPDPFARLSLLGG